MTQRRDEGGIDRPAPGSHDPSTPTGSLETSSANLFEVMVAAREAQERGDGDGERLHAFYRTLMSGTVLLPVPPDHGEEAQEALASAVDEDQEVEISVMLARDAAGDLLRGLAGGAGASAAVDVPAGTDLVWLEEPLLSSVRRVARPFYRRGRG